jgi:cell division initiation protein
MKITPLDIRRQTFKKVMRGYDCDEVNAFLEMVSTEFESLLKTATLSKEKNEILQADVEKYTNIEKTLQDTLVSAQKATEEIKRNSQKESDLIVKEGELKAEKLVGNARSQLEGVNNDIAVLKRQKKTFIVRLRSLIQSQLEMLEVMDRDDEGARPGIKEGTAPKPFPDHGIKTEALEQDLDNKGATGL